MKIAVVGLWHLGCVTAACLSQAKHQVLAFDPNKETIQLLANGGTPIFEPGLETLLQQGKENGHLTFTNQVEDLAQAKIIWVTFDTPVNEQDVADVQFVKDHIKAILPHLQVNTLILISSQIPVGTTRELQAYCKAHYADKHFTFAVSPENLRLGKAIDVFMRPDRIIVGIEAEIDKTRIQHLFNPFTHQLIWMSIESAEMTKHALNAFLATSVVFINELAVLCEKVGANAKEVEMGLKSEDRIGPKAYLRPGAAIAGGTLARDVNYLIQVGEAEKIETPLFSALLKSNEAHKLWSKRRMLDILKNLRDKKIVTLGLTYKAGTDTLRRSSALEMCEWLNEAGAKVVAYDPVVSTLPSALAQFIELKTSVQEALKDADAILIATEWPQFTSLTAEEILSVVKDPIIFDASGFLMKALGNDKRIRYFSVGNKT